MMETSLALRCTYQKEIHSWLLKILILAGRIPLLLQKTHCWFLGSTVEKFLHFLSFINLLPNIYGLITKFRAEWGFNPVSHWQWFNPESFSSIKMGVFVKTWVQYLKNLPTYSNFMIKRNKLIDLVLTYTNMHLYFCPMGSIFIFTFLNLVFSNSDMPWSQFQRCLNLI